MWLSLIQGDKGQRTAGLCYPGGSYCGWPRLRFRLPWRWVHALNFIWHGSFHLFFFLHIAKVVLAVFMCSAHTNWLQPFLGFAFCCKLLAQCKLSSMYVHGSSMHGLGISLPEQSHKSAHTLPDMQSTQGRWMLCRSRDNQMVGSQCEHGVWVPRGCAL